MNNLTDNYDRRILSFRGEKNSVNPALPYAWLTEKECTQTGQIEDVSVVFLTNRECPFHCMVCDLWKSTTDETMPEGSIASQISIALRSLPPSRHLKLYNSGSFFDTRAIPYEEYSSIAKLVENFDSVVVESHPFFINDKCIEFRDMMKPILEVAIGLETIHRKSLERLNKHMTISDFRNAVRFLNYNGISSRAFILLKLPFMTEDQGVIWAERSMEFAFECGVDCCSVIPVRPGNGMVEYLALKGHYSPPRMESLEKVLEYGIRMKAGRVFADTWDLSLFSDCDKCLPERVNRINMMNLSQKLLPPVACSCQN
jgi:radical SAM enzyme (TIGR01210 family)